MKTHRSNLIKTVCISLILIQVACIPFGDAWVKFSGKIVDTEGKPVSNAQLTILFNGKVHSEQSNAVSKATGEYSFFENSCPCDFDFEIVVKKVGFKPYSKKMTGREANNLKTFDIVLEHEDKIGSIIMNHEMKSKA